MGTKLVRFCYYNSSVTGLFADKYFRLEYFLGCHKTIKNVSFMTYLVCRRNYFNLPIINNGLSDLKTLRVPMIRLVSSERTRLSTCYRENKKGNKSEKVIVNKIVKAEKVSEIKSLLDELSKQESYSNSDFEKIYDFLLNAKKIFMVNDKNVQTIAMKFIANYNNLNFARSYLYHLKNHNIIIHPVTIASYLKLMYNHWSDHIPEDVNIVEDLCNQLLKFPLLELKVTESLIFGLCLTKRWKESFKVIEKFKEFYDITRVSYSAIIKASFKNNEFDVGIKLLDDQMSNGWYPHQSVYESWLEESKDKSYALNNLLNLFSKYNEELFMDVARNILKQVQNLQIKSNQGNQQLAGMTEVNNKGICRHCNNPLNLAVLTSDEFERLRSSFLKSVLLGKDVFQKTLPEELETFKEFIKKTAPYDFVLDGLNIAYSIGFKNSSSEGFANMLKTVVQYFVERDKKILILGREHMKTWPKKSMNYIDKNANLFLINDLSEDDPFLLYAALYSGLNTNFLSRDLMRGHKYLLSVENIELNTIFWKWQCSHQYMLIYALSNGDIILKPPVKHLQSAHYVMDKNGKKRWHVPCKPINDSYVPGHKKFNLKKWLCIPEL